MKKFTKNVTLDLFKIDDNLDNITINTYEDSVKCMSEIFQPKDLSKPYFETELFQNRIWSMIADNLYQILIDEILDVYYIGENKDEYEEIRKIVELDYTIQFVTKNNGSGFVIMMHDSIKEIMIYFQSDTILNILNRMKQYFNIKHIEIGCFRDTLEVIMTENETYEIYNEYMKDPMIYYNNSKSLFTKKRKRETEFLFLLPAKKREIDKEHFVFDDYYEIEEKEPEKDVFDYSNIIDQINTKEFQIQTLTMKYNIVLNANLQKLIDRIYNDKYEISFGTSSEKKKCYVTNESLNDHGTLIIKYKNINIYHLSQNIYNFAMDINNLKNDKILQQLDIDVLNPYEHVNIENIIPEETSNKEIIDKEEKNESIEEYVLDSGSVYELNKNIVSKVNSFIEKYSGENLKKTYSRYNSNKFVKQFVPNVSKEKCYITGIAIDSSDVCLEISNSKSKVLYGLSKETHEFFENIDTIIKNGEINTIKI